LNFLRQKISGIAMRLQCYAYGITYFRNKDFTIPSSLRINGHKKKLRFVDTASSAFLYEFTEICLQDCYRLKMLKKQLNSITNVVDIGANQGLFAIAARRHFAKAAIACYEPNPALEPILALNTTSLDADVFYEAVTREDCKISLSFGETDLNTVAKPDEMGEITGVSLRKVIERAGGNIDILKLDCEGGEWAIMEDIASWKKIRSVTMEYHLWARPGSTVAEIKERIGQLGFRIISHNPVSEQFGLLAAVK